MKDMLRKLKSQRGATGIDVIMSAAMILVSIAVVSMLYVNTSFQSRNMTRTSAATRIATNVAEYIQTLSYEDFLKIYNVDMTQEATYKGETYKTFSSYDEVNRVQTERKIFDTKVPAGYNFYIKADNVYGSHSGAGHEKEQFDLVREIDIVVTFNVGKNLQEVSFSITKQRELIGECNAPSMAYLRSTTQLGPDTVNYPIKYDERIGSYVRTTEDDIDWYNYKNKKWALAVASSRPESELFDANGKFKYIKTDTQIYVWIPRFFVDPETSEFAAFTFNSSNFLIKPGQLVSQTAEDGTTSTFNYYTFAENAEDLLHERESSETGHWLLLRDDTDSISADEYASKLDNSIYGPFEY